MHFITKLLALFLFPCIIYLPSSNFYSLSSFITSFFSIYLYPFSYTHISTSISLFFYLFISLSISIDTMISQLENQTKKGERKQQSSKGRETELKYIASFPEMHACNMSSSPQGNPHVSSPILCNRSPNDLFDQESCWGLFITALFMHQLIVYQNSH